VKAKVAQLTAGKTTEQEKVQAVYRYVATEIHYIGVAFGVGRYQPHSAGDVLANQYGDCKDKHTLLAAMLQVLGLHPDAVLIGAGLRFNEAVPSPGSFNHLITRVDVDGKPVWLDTTAEVLPYGMLLYVTRDESALAIPAMGVAKIVKTPAKPPFEQVNTMEATGALDSDGVSKSKITLTFRGDTEVQFRAVLRQVSPAQYDQLAQNIAGSMGYAGTASHLEVNRPEDTSAPLTMSFDYKRVKGGDWANYRAIPQLAPVALPQVDDKEPPVESLALGVPRVESSSSAMKLPEGWGVELPEAIHAKSPWATYDLTYRFENGTMYAQRKVEILAERVPVAEMKAYEKFAKDADIANEQYVQLTRVKVSTAGSSGTGTVTIDGPPAAGENNVEAAKLVDRAEQAMKSFDLVTTASLLDQAKALNANQRGLWSLYEYVCFRKGDLPGAVKDYQKEIDLHPMATNVYPYLVQAQVALNQNEAAEKTLRQWAQADPAAEKATLQLGSMLIDDGKPAEAAKAVEEALAASPGGDKPNEALELMLGRAQLRAGMKDKGHQTLLSLVKTTDNPDMMNDAAYELADAGLELPLAEQTTRAALDKMEQQSLTWTLDENEQTLRTKTRMLQATWDTMGWVYFREGNLVKAEQYVRASWLGRQDAEVGKHMGEIEAARGNKNAALLDYQMALATIPTYDMLGVHKERRTPVEVDLAARIEGLRKGGAQGGATDPTQALQKLRFLPLGPANGLNGTAEYKLLVSGGAVGRIEPTGDKTLAGGVNRLKKAPLSALVPAGSMAQLVLGAMLNCHSGVCELVVEQ
jgi:tetratricopeptide (TPR) repeat protein